MQGSKDSKKWQEAKHFPLEKILNIGVRDYCESQGKKLRDYEMIGVHAEGKTLNEIFEKFGKQADIAKIIVNYKFKLDISNSDSGDYRDQHNVIIASGTALIPKSRSHGTGTGGH